MDLSEMEWGHGMNWSGSEQRQVLGACECGDEPSDSTKCGEYFEWLRSF